MPAWPLSISSRASVVDWAKISLLLLSFCFCFRWSCRYTHKTNNHHSNIKNLTDFGHMSWMVLLTIFPLPERAATDWVDFSGVPVSSTGRCCSSSDWNWRRFNGWFLTILFGGSVAPPSPTAAPPSLAVRFSFRGFGSAFSENCGVSGVVGDLKSFRGGIHSETVAPPESSVSKFARTKECAWGDKRAG